MFATDVIIDTIQNGKKQIVNTFVTDSKFKAELINLVDTQTEFAKGSAKSSLAIMQAFVKNATENFHKFKPLHK